MVWRTVASQSSPVEITTWGAQLADRTVVIGPASAAQSYLAIPRLITAAQVTGCDALHPGYGFAGHKGYRAPIHAEALRTLGPCEIHRMGWNPVKLALMGKDPMLALDDALQEELPFEG